MNRIDQERVMLKATDREAPGVERAFAIGMVWCDHCQVVHIDMVNEDEKIFGTAFLTWEKFLEIVEELKQQRRDDSLN